MGGKECRVGMGQGTPNDEIYTHAKCCAGKSFTSFSFLTETTLQSGNDFLNLPQDEANFYYYSFIHCLHEERKLANYVKNENLHTIISSHLDDFAIHRQVFNEWA